MEDLHYPKLLKLNNLTSEDLPLELSEKIKQLHSYVSSDRDLEDKVDKERVLLKDKEISEEFLAYLKKESPDMDILSYEESLIYMKTLEEGISDYEETDAEKPVEVKHNLIHGFKITNHDDQVRKAIIGVFGHINQVNFGSEAGIEIEMIDNDMKFGDVLKNMSAADDFKVDDIIIHSKNKEQLNQEISRREDGSVGNGRLLHIIGNDIEGDTRLFNCNYIHTNIEALEVVILPNTTLELNLLSKIAIDESKSCDTKEIIIENREFSEEEKSEGKDVELEEVEVTSREIVQEEVEIQEVDKTPEWAKEALSKFYIEHEGKEVALPFIFMTQDKHDEIMGRLGAAEKRIKDLESKKWYQNNK